MAEVWLRVAAFACSVCGMAFIALAMPAHWQQVRGSSAQPAHVARRLRVLGGAALALALALSLRADHPTIAPLVWTMMLTAATVLIALTLASRPTWLAFLIAFLRAPGKTPPR